MKKIVYESGNTNLSIYQTEKGINIDLGDYSDWQVGLSITLTRENVIDLIDELTKLTKDE